MSNVHRLRDAKSAERQASDWLALLVTGDASDADRARHKAWLGEHPSHQAAFDRVGQTWGQLRAIGDEVRIAVPADLDPNAMAELLATSDNKWRWIRRLTWAAAAAAVFVITIVGMIVDPFSDSSVYRTEVGQQMSFTLPDRSTVELNTDTELVVTYSDRARTIELRRGEAFFDVAHDESRPFVVEAGRGAIRAVGTGFVVRVQNQAVKVTVTEGIVEVTHESHDHSDRQMPSVDVDEPSPSKLSEGQRVEYDQRVVSVEAVEQGELDRDLAWRQGLLIFDGQSLEEVVREVERYVDTRFIVADGDLQQLRVGGAFKAGDLEAVLEFFDRGLNITVNREIPRTVYLTAATAQISE